MRTGDFFRGRMKRTRSAAAILSGVLALLLTVTSCAKRQTGSDGEFPVGQALREEFSSLVSGQNGLYYHPFLREEPAGPEAQSYALRTLTLLGTEARATNDSADIDALRREALSSSPLWGRYWLVPVARYGDPDALPRADADEVAQHRTSGGWYEDPALGDTNAAHAGGTWAALEVLAALGRIPAGDLRTSTVDWLTRASRAKPDIQVAGALARSLSLLKADVPASLTRLRPPATDGFAGLAAERKQQLLEETYSYVLVQRAADRRPVIDTATWKNVLAHNADTLDYEHLYYLAEVLRAADLPVRELQPIQRRLEKNQLADGDITDPDSYAGSLDASSYVQRLRTLADLPTDDPDLLTALNAVEKEAGTDWDNGDRLMAAALRRKAGEGSGGDADVRKSTSWCAGPDILPRTLTLHLAAAWRRNAVICAEAGVEVPEPQVKPWNTDTAEGLVAAAELVVGLSDAGLSDEPPSWLAAEDLLPWVLHPARMSNLYNYAVVARAYILLGGAADIPVRRALRSETTARRGCPGYPDLYRTDSRDPGCDLRTTWAVWTLDQQLDGALHAVPARAVESSRE
ncbi:hypothetical protein OG936_20420 [Streptomyces sp. NBC_00846]|uniref:hypothetical protein n=1 Tax=Streptomyces sp. NBC_00846 TaxID=2975849 RepID=UPI00386D29ED|nr:hypothetical protein OG936_20420 [Streptomyces sp. NBC_00846]